MYQIKALFADYVFRVRMLLLAQGQRQIFAKLAFVLCAAVGSDYFALTAQVGKVAAHGRLADKKGTAKLIYVRAAVLTEIFKYF
jgi:hypothetical protein